MIDIAKLRVGDKVHYQPEHYGDSKWENGIIKEIRQEKMDGVWVVYNCNGEWYRYRDYTGCLTNLRDLRLGWKHKKQLLAFCDKHQQDKIPAMCGNCADGYLGHECGEDTCCCMDPEDNVLCDLCNGEGVVKLCPQCAPDAEFL